MSRRTWFALASTLALAACNNNPGKGAAHASVDQPVEAASVSPSPAGTKFSFSQDGSKIEFVGAKVTGKHNGSFGTFSGTINVVDGNPERSSVTADIEIASISTEIEKLTGHLKSPDFFDAAKFPKARFTSTAIKAGGANGATHTVTGNLDLHGVSKSITFPATISISGDNVTVNADFAINRKDFGLVYPGMPDDLIKDDVLIKLSINAKKS